MNLTFDPSINQIVITLYLVLQSIYLIRVLQEPIIFSQTPIVSQQSRDNKRYGLISLA